MTDSEINAEALKMIREVTDGALDYSELIEAVYILISQRDNARNEADHFKKMLKDNGLWS